MILCEGNKRSVTLRLCTPRGFCAGVERAVRIVLLALRKYGAPVYVRHEIVHNRSVVNGLCKLGVVFISELHEIPADHRSQPVIFSAHGVPLSVKEESGKLNLLSFDATCPLVSKVHKQALRHYRSGRHVLLIGHAGHPEVIGTTGQLPEGAVTLIESAADIDRLKPSKPEALGYVSQTTLSVGDTAVLIDRLKERFPRLHAPASESICYATTHRQEAVREAASGVDLFFVVGSPNSSNSQRLVEVAQSSGARACMLVSGVEDIPWSRFADMSVFALSAGASAPDILIDHIILAFQQRYHVDLYPVITAIEEENFPVMKELHGISLTKEDTAFLGGSLKAFERQKELGSGVL